MVWASYKSEPNHALIRAIVQIAQLGGEVKGRFKRPQTSQHQKAFPKAGLWKRIRLAFLSPKLVTAILDGTTNQELTINKLSARDIPLNWGGAACTVPVLNSLLIRIKFPVIFSTHAQNPNGTWGFIKPAI